MFRFHAALAALLLSAAGVQAQAVCGASTLLEEGLARSHGEMGLVSGVTPEKYRLRFFCNLTTGSWTVLVISPHGLACVRSFGDGCAIDKLPPEPKEDL